MDGNAAKSGDHETIYNDKAHGERRYERVWRLTTNKDVSEMNMVELAHNSCYVKDHQAMFRSYDFDIDARNLARKLIRDIAKCNDDLSDNDYFDEWISDFLSDGTDSIEGLIAVFYSNLWAMAELRERLKEYEDIGLLPEQIREVDKLYAEKCKELAELQKKMNATEEGV